MVIPGLLEQTEHNGAIMVSGERMVLTHPIGAQCLAQLRCFLWALENSGVSKTMAIYSDGTVVAGN